MTIPPAQLSRAAPAAKTVAKTAAAKPGMSRRARLAALSGGAAAVLAAAAGGWLLFGHGSSAPKVGPEGLVQQMQQAAEGAPITENLYGGALVVERTGQTLVVTVDGIPPSICVSAGWKLVRKGLLSINGTTPNRVSAARLADLCNQGNATAILAWIPRPE